MRKEFYFQFSVIKQFEKREKAENNVKNYYFFTFCFRPNFFSSPRERETAR